MAVAPIRDLLSLEEALLLAIFYNFFWFKCKRRRGGFLKAWGRGKGRLWNCFGPTSSYVSWHIRVPLGVSNGPGPPENLTDPTQPERFWAGLRIFGEGVL